MLFYSPISAITRAAAPTALESPGPNKANLLALNPRLTRSDTIRLNGNS